MKNIQTLCKFLKFGPQKKFDYRQHKLQYISDLHLEYRNKFTIIPQIGNYLALIGDIGNPFKQNYEDFLKYTSNNYEKIFLVAGNHEYWQKETKASTEEVRNQIQHIANKHPNIYFLDNNVYQFDEKYVILGSTLWSYRNKPDNDLDVKNNLEYIKNVEWIKQQIQMHSNMSIIMLTHYLPSYKLIIEKYRQPQYATDKYASHLDHLIHPPIKYWLCGHSHCTFETYINSIYCGINAVGYPHESTTPLVRCVDIS